MNMMKFIRHRGSEYDYNIVVNVIMVCLEEWITVSEFCIVVCVKESSNWFYDAFGSFLSSQPIYALTHPVDADIGSFLNIFVLLCYKLPVMAS